MAFNFAVLFKLSNNAFHHFATFVDVSVLTTSKQNGHLHFVVVLKETDGLLDLEVDIVVTGFPFSRFFFLSYLNFPKSMMRHTGGLASAATSTRSNPDSRARVDPILILIDCCFL